MAPLPADLQDRRVEITAPSSMVSLREGVVQPLIGDESLHQVTFPAILD